MKILLFVVLTILIFVLVLSPKSFLRHELYCKKMEKLYLKYIQDGFDNFSALKKISKNRHPELSDIVHERLVSKFSELKELIEFIYWGIEVYLWDEKDFTDENALALIEAGNVILQGQGYKVIVDKNRIAPIHLE